MPVTLTTLREGVSRLLGDWLQATTTTNITGSDKYIISTELDRFPQDDYFDSNWWVLITSGNNINVRRGVKGFSATNDRIEVYGANLAAETGAVTFELHRFDPDEIKAMLNRTRIEVFSVLNVPILVPNDHYEVWSQAAYPDYWRVSGVTAAKETGAANIHNGAASAKVTRADVDGYLYISTSLGTTVLPLDVYNALWALRGQKVIFSRWVKTSIASQARLMIYCGSTSRTRYSKYHSGGGAFEYLEVEFDIPWDASEIGFRCLVETSDGAVYFDGPGSGEESGTPGVGYLSTLNLDADAMELNTEQALGLEYQAAALVLQNQINPVGSTGVGKYAANSDWLMKQAKRILAAHRSPLPVPRIDYSWLGDLESEG